MAISSEDVEAIKEELREDLREELKEELREELSPPGRSRRDVIKLGGAALGGAALGSVGGAAGAVGAGDEFLDVGSVTANTYRVTGNWYGGPEGAESELVSVLDADDTGARYEADDTGAKFYWNGSGWDVIDTSGGKRTEIGPSTGTDLQALIEDRANEGYTVLDVTSPSDGSAYTWGSGWTVFPDDYHNGLIIRIDDNVDIDASALGSVWAFDVDWRAVGAIGEQLSGTTFEISGGVWDMGSSASFCRIFDAFECTIVPDDVIFSGSAGSGQQGVELVSKDQWCEHNRIGGRYKSVDVGIKTTDAGTSTGGMSDNVFEDMTVAAHTRGFDLEGNLKDCKFDTVTGFAESDNSVFMYLNGDFSNTIMFALEFEEIASGVTGSTMYETGPNYSDNSPKIIGGVDAATNAITRNDPGDIVYRERITQGIKHFENIDGTSYSMDFLNDKHIFKDASGAVVIENDSSGNTRLNGGSLYQVNSVNITEFPRILTISGRSSDPGAAGANDIDLFFRHDLATPELRAIDDTGTVSTIATF